MSTTSHPAPRLTWRQLFRTEMVWRRRVMAEVSTREIPPKPSVDKMRSVIRKGIVATFWRSGWSASSPAYVFVSFGKNPLVEQTRAHGATPIFNPEGKARDILQGRSLIELDALYYLLHGQDLYPRPMRKWMMGRLMRWLDRHLPALQQQAFITHQDYFDKSSVLHSIAAQVPMQILGMQHGLLRHHYLHETATFPGVRSRQHIVYSPLYGDLMRQHRADAEIHVLGPPFEVGGRHDPPTAARPTDGLPAGITLLFISSDDLRFPERRRTIDSLHQLCKANGIDFKVRPHPQERDLMATTPLPFAIDGKEQVFASDPGQLVFAGFFSTFLYEAAMRGFKTAWIARPGAADATADLPETQDIPNATVLTSDGVGQDWLSRWLAQAIAPVDTSPVGARMHKVLVAAFPALN